MRPTVAVAVAVAALLLSSGTAPAAAAAPWVAMGCSNTQMSTRNVPEFDLSAANLPGGELDQWDPANRKPKRDYWGMFEAQSPATAVGIWWQICIRPGSSTGEAANAAALRVLAEIQARAPGVPVYVSPLNSYDPEMPAYVDYYLPTLDPVAAAVDAGAFEGPALGPLTPSLVVRDGRHPNRPGMTFLADQLGAFVRS